MKLEVIMLAAVLVAVGSFAGPIQISVTGTADSTNMGYTIDESYTFTWTVNDEFDGGQYDGFVADQNRWNAETTSDPWLWSSVSGDGLSGTYTRPSGDDDAPYDFLSASSVGLNLFAGGDAVFDFTSFTELQPSLGLTANGTDIAYINGDNLDIPGLDYSDTAFVNPDSWLASYTGTYALSTGWIGMTSTQDDQIYFTPTSATIAAIPEPSVIALVGIFGGGLFGVRRIFMI